jgi:hypothetical protein
VQIGTRDRDRIVGSYIVDQLMRRQYDRRPALLVPQSVQYPASLRCYLGEGGDALAELGLALGVGQVNADEICSAQLHMYVRIVETRQHETPI